MDWLFNKANFLHDLYIELQNVVSPLFAQLGKVPLVRQSDLVLLQTRIVQLLDVSWQYLKPLIDPRAYQHTYQKIAVGLVSTWMAKGIVRLFLTRITLLKIIKLILLFVFLSITPAPSAQSASKTTSTSSPSPSPSPLPSDASTFDLLYFNELKSPLTPTAALRVEASTARQPSLLEVTLTQGPSVLGSIVDVGKAYWKLGNQVLAIGKATLPVLRQHTKNWGEVLKVVTRMLQIFERMSNEKDRMPSQSSGSSREVKVGSMA